MAYGILGVSPDMIAQQQRIRGLPSDPKETLLAKYLVQLAQQNKVGTPEYYMAAGEFQNRQKMRQEQAAKAQNPPPVVAEITAQAAQKAMPPVVAAPIDRGVAALPAQNVGEYALGGIVSFENGGEVQRFQNQGMVTARVPSFMGMFGGPSERTAVAQPSMLSGIAFNEYGVPISVEEFVRKLRQDNPNITAGEIQTATNEFVRKQTRAMTPPATQAPATAPATMAQVSQPATTTAPATVEKPKVGIETIAPADYGRFMKEAGKMTSGIMGDRPTVPTDAEAVSAVRDVYKQAGVNLDLFKQQAEELKKQGEEAKLDKKEAMNMRLVEAGLGILGGESPYAFVNIGKGATPAFKGLSEDLKDLKKLERDRQKAIRDLQVAENQLSAGIGKEAVDRKEKAERRLDSYAEREAVIKNSVFNTLVSSDTQRSVANLSAKTTMAKEGMDREDQNKLRAYQEANKEMMKLMTTNPLLAQDPAAYEDAFNKVYQRALQAIQTGRVGSGVDLSQWGTPRVKQ